MVKKTVALLFGGASSEHEVSIMSALNIISGLSEEKYNIIPIYITREGQWFLYDGAADSLKNADLERLDTRAFLCPDASQASIIRLVGDKARNIPIDIVFPVLHGRNGEDGNIQGLCELARVPYVGAGVLASALCMDKQITKVIAQSIGLKQAKHLCFTRREAEDDIDAIFRKVKSKLKLPCFVKPANTGSSIGITKAVDKESFKKAVALALAYDKKFIVEAMVKGRELECSVLGNLSAEASKVGEIVTGSADGFYDYNRKYIDEGALTVITPELSPEIEQEVRNQAVRVYKAVDCLGMARVDFFLEEGTNEIIFNEINTIPGFTAISMYSMLWQASGMTINKLCDRLIELGLERYGL